MSSKQPTSFLSGLVIAVTRDQQGSSELASLISAKGAVVREYPLLHITYRALDGVRNALGDFLPDMIVFTSVHGVRAYEMIFSRDLSYPWLTLPAACVGIKTAEAAKQIGMQVLVTPSDANAQTLCSSLIDSQFIHKRFLWVRGNMADREAFSSLAQSAHGFRDAVMYDTTSTSRGIELATDVFAGGIDLIVFMSGSAVRAFAKALTDLHKLAKDIPSQVILVSIGSKTTRVMQEHGLQPHVTARMATAEVMLHDVEEYVQHKKG